MTTEIDKDLLNVAEEIKQDIDDRLNRLKSSSIKSSAIELPRSLKGQGLETNTIFVMQEAALDEDSDFNRNPKKACMQLALNICLSENSNYARNFSHTSEEQLPDISPEQKRVLAQLYDMFMSPECATYGDQQIFMCNNTGDSPNLAELSKLISACRGTIALFDDVYIKLYDLYRRARSDLKKLRLAEDTAEQQQDLLLASALDSLNKQRSTLQSAIDEGRLVYMKQITYPSGVSKYVCGHCGQVNSATDLIRTHLKKYRSDNGIQSDTFIFVPCECNNPECRFVNLPNAAFETGYKLAVQARLLNNAFTISSEATLTYSLDMMLDTAVVPEVLIENYQPQIVEESHKQELPVPEYSDLFSRETYESYLSMLSLQKESRKLEINTTRNTYFLKYILSQLHIFTVGYTEEDFVYSCAERFGGDDFRDLIQEYKRSIGVLADLTVLLNVLKNYKYPLCGYRDQQIGIDYISDLLTRYKDIFTDDPETKLNGSNLMQTIGTLEQYISNVQAKRDTLEVALHEKCRNIATALVGIPAVITADMYNTFDTDIPDDLFVISKCRNTGDDLFRSGIGSMLWNEIECFYNNILINTVIANRRTIYTTALFRAVFLHTGSKRTSDIRTLYEKLGSPLSRQNISSIAEMENDDVLLFILKSCLQATSLDALISAIGTTKENLLRAKVRVLPSLDYAQELTLYSALDSTKFSDLSMFAKGISVDGFADMLKNDDTDTFSQDTTGVDCETLAEIAYDFYLVCVSGKPTGSDKNAASHNSTEYTNTFDRS